MLNIQRASYQLLFIILGFLILYFGKPFLFPVAFAGVLATLMIGLTNKMEGRGIKRSLSSLIAVLIIVVAIAAILALLAWRLRDFSEGITGMKDSLLNVFENLKKWIDNTLGISADQQEDLVKQTEKSTGDTADMLMAFVSGTTDVLVKTLLVLVYTFLFLLYRSRIKNFILKLVADSDKLKTEKIITRSVHVSKHYLSGLAVMIAILWVLYGIGFSIVGIQNALFFAILCGLLEIVPFIGNLTGTSVTVLAVVTQGGGTEMIIGVILVYGLVQFIQTYILEPLVVGDQVNINPLFTILALVLGELIWGIGGMVLALPLLGMVKIICDHIPTLKPFGYLIGTDRKKRKNIFKSN
ncbi:AI-2E family transporter [Olivibacter sp. SDN3]|uniref:AI-2E family transporter n=1 Tax=Olivibacter sp. SDN3 TaxID=2764720 RepID=UPI0016511DEC|nr:AI-2E family transporter [Olivibacter sp. SDN3]QNL47933.1 AI-2E family transporter [Olivibacter sp. SDN3]